MVKKINYFTDEEKQKLEANDRAFMLAMEAVKAQARIERQATERKYPRRSKRVVCD